MIFDIYEQEDLFKIANCGKKKTLIGWLNINKITFMFDAKGMVIAHKQAVDSALGVESPAEQRGTVGRTVVLPKIRAAIALAEGKK